MKLEGQVAIITGAGRGIGRAIALAYAREGARLALAARNEAELEETAAAVSELGGEAITVRTDVTSQIATERLARRVIERFGSIDVLVNNAGISGPVGPLQSNDIAEWVDTINVNLTGTFLMCRAVIPVMLQQGGGRIINLSGAGVANAWSNMSAYCSSKAAVVRLTEVIAQELDGQGDHGQRAGPRVGTYQHVGTDDGTGCGMRELNSSTNWVRGCCREAVRPLTIARSWRSGWPPAKAAP